MLADFAIRYGGKREGWYVGDSVSLRDALALPQLQRVRVLAGAEGLDRPVRYVNVMEVPDILDWVKPDELLLTTAYPLRDDRASLAELVPRLADKGLAGLAVKPARYLDAVPRVMLEAADRLAFPLLELPPEAVLADIINAVLGTILNAQALRLQRSAAVHERFTSIVLGGGGLREIADALDDLLGRAVAVVDPEGQLLARSARFPVGHGHSWAQPVTDLGEALCWVTLPVVDAPRAAALQPIQAGPERLGAVIVLAGQTSLADEELIAVERAAAVAALRLVQARAVAEADQRFQAVCLDELVTRHLADRGVLRERAAAFGWDLTVARAVLVAGIERLGDRAFAQLAGTPDEGRARHQLAAAARVALGSEAILWERSAGVAALVPWTDARTDRLAALGSALQAEMTRRMPTAVVSIGIGRAYADPLELAASYTEALRALVVGRQASGSGQVALFEQLGLERLLLACPEAELTAFQAATLEPLVAYERTHPGSGLGATLAAFLAADRNVARAARSLYAHYNTTRYRLDRLEQLLGPFVGDPRRCLELELALQVDRLLAHTDANTPPRPTPPAALGASGPTATRASFA